MLNRLVGAVDVKIGKDDRDMLKEVRDARNAIEHYETDIDIKEVDTLVGKLVDFLERFLADELQESLLRHLPHDAAEEVRELANIAERERNRRHAEWSRRADRYARVTRKRLAKIAAENEYHPKHNPNARLLECPECSGDTVAIVEGDIGLCTEWDCRERHMLSACDQCGEHAIIGDGPYCTDCMDHAADVLARE